MKRFIIIMNSNKNINRQDAKVEQRTQNVFITYGLTRRLLLLLVLGVMGLVAYGQKDTIIIVGAKEEILLKTKYNENLNVALAKKILYKKYNQNKDSTEKYSCFIYDTAYFCDINKDGKLDAIILYRVNWDFNCGILESPFNCRNHVLSKVIVISNADGYFLSNVDFIEESYIIKNIFKDKDNNVVITGYDWDCVNKIIIKDYKVILK